MAALRIPIDQFKRPIMKRSSLPVLLLVFAACTTAITPGAGDTRTSVSAERIRADISAVSADAVLRRAPATRGEELTTSYIRDRLQAAGVQPGGPNGSWFQEVPLRQSDITRTPSLSFAVGGHTLPLTQGEHIAA